MNFKELKPILKEITENAGLKAKEDYRKEYALDQTVDLLIHKPIIDLFNYEVEVGVVRMCTSIKYYKYKIETLLNLYRE